MSDARKKSRLGRGLGSLMGYTETVTETEPGLSTPVIREIPAALPAIPRGTPDELPIDQIVPNPRQPRRQFDELSLVELADSIKANGLIQPIVVRSAGDGYELIAGERRLRACKLAGMARIPAYIRAADELEQAQLALVENVQREDLNAIDRAAAYHMLIHELGLTQADLSTRIGEDRSVISNHLRLLELPADVQALVRDGSLSLGHAKVIAGVPDAADQSRLAKLVVGQSLSVRNLERVIATPGEAASRELATPPSAHVRSVELALSRQLGLRVQLRTGAAKSKGKLVIHYKSLDEFDTLMNRLGATLDD
jgi:ParB family transcriptional regulator, chromosome partitioning protein